MDIEEEIMSELPPDYMRLIPEIVDARAKYGSDPVELRDVTRGVIKNWMFGQVGDMPDFAKDKVWDLISPIVDTVLQRSTSFLPPVPQLPNDPPISTDPLFKYDMGTCEIGGKAVPVELTVTSVGIQVNVPNFPELEGMLQTLTIEINSGWGNASMNPDTVRNALIGNSGYTIHN
jgi:hypothetical protein